MESVSELRRLRKRDLARMLELRRYLNELTDPEEIDGIECRIFELGMNIDYLSDKIYKEKCKWNKM